MNRYHQKEEYFFGKMILNWMKTYRHTSFDDGIILRSIVENFEDTSIHQKWIKKFYSLRDEFLGDSGKKSISTNEFIKKTDADELADLLEEEIGIDFQFQLLDNTKIIGEMLELDATELLFLDLAVRLSTVHDWQISSALSKFSFFFNDMTEMYTTFFHLSDEEIRRVQKQFLFQSGLLVPWNQNRHFFCIHSDMVEAFTTPNLSIDTLEKSLFPSDLQTDLTPEMYPHLTKEIALTETIINKSLAEHSRGTNIMFHGLPGTGKTLLAVSLAKKNNWRLISVGDISDVDNQEKSRAQRLTSLKIALKLYASDNNTVILFDEMEDLFKIDTKANFSKAFINRIIENSQIPIIWTTNSLEALGSAVLRRMMYNIIFEMPPASARKTMWNSYTEKYGVELGNKTIDKLSDTYDIVPALIGNAVKIAKFTGINVDDVPEIVGSLDRLVNFGIKRKFSEDRENSFPYDIECVNSSLDLNKLTSKLLTAKPNFSLCLYGPAGTGKTEYGKHLAKQLNKKVIYRRASDLLGMYLGQTEQQIAQAFAQASDEEKILIIDEGDSFLRNREMAKHSWEVTQVNEMLTQMETHNQPFIITTNLMQDLDSASLRRFTFKIKFDFLKDNQIETLFEKYFNVSCPPYTKSMEYLTPGDFGNVKRRADVLDITDAEELHGMLREEMEAKPHIRPRYGF